MVHILDGYLEINDFEVFRYYDLSKAFVPIESSHKYEQKKVKKNKLFYVRPAQHVI